MRLAICLLALLCTVSSARAENLAQLTLEGVVQAETGGRVEFTVGARRLSDGQPRKVDLGVHVAAGTSGTDLMELLASRLQAAGLSVVQTRDHGEPGVRKSHLFVERALFIRARVSPGLTVTITACEAAPLSLRVIASDAHKGAGQLIFGASTWQPHSERSGSARLTFELTDGAHGSLVAETLFRVATESGWIGERISADEWAPTRMKDGSRVRGMSVRLESEADWGLHIVFSLN